MSTTPAEVVRGTALPPVLSARAREHRFFTGMALLCILIAFVGFAPSYYLRSFSAGPPLTTLVHLHGGLASSWLLLFFAQTSLVTVGRTDLHRRMGILGAAIVVLFVVVGYLTALTAVRRGHAPPFAPSPPAFLAVALVGLLSFTVLAGLGIAWRRQRETHRRLMLLATIALLAPAFARIRWLGPGGPPVVIGGTYLLVLTCMAWDWRVHGRIHRAFLWGGGLLMISLPARFALAHWEGWLPIGRWLMR